MGWPSERFGLLNAQLVFLSGLDVGDFIFRVSSTLPPGGLILNHVRIGAPCFPSLNANSADVPRYVLVSQPSAWVSVVLVSKSPLVTRFLPGRDRLIEQLKNYQKDSTSDNFFIASPLSGYQMSA
ncbi:MAG: hypothetical protein R2874_09515 [Desulfobacterales bacterium]